MKKKTIIIMGVVVLTYAMAFWNGYGYGWKKATNKAAEMVEEAAGEIKTESVGTPTIFYTLPTSHFSQWGPVTSYPSEPPIGWAIEHNIVTGEYRFCYPSGFCSAFGENSRKEAVEAAWTQAQRDRDNAEANWKREGKKAP